jgi:hypothetical protein
VQAAPASAVVKLSAQHAVLCCTHHLLSRWLPLRCWRDVWAAADEAAACLADGSASSVGSPSAQSASGGATEDGSAGGAVDGRLHGRVLRRFRQRATGRIARHAAAALLQDVVSDSSYCSASQRFVWPLARAAASERQVSSRLPTSRPASITYTDPRTA